MGLFLAPIAILLAPILVPFNFIFSNIIVDYFPSVFAYMVAEEPIAAVIFMVYTNPLGLPGMLWDMFLQLF